VFHASASPYFGSIAKQGVFLRETISGPHRINPVRRPPSYHLRMRRQLSCQSPRETGIVKADSDPCIETNDSICEPLPHRDR